ncbi:hypothetical protein GX50_08001, partial [[Emmonsia] crescens]
KIYKKNSETWLEAERAIKVFYNKNKNNLECCDVTEALINDRGIKHNDSCNSDLKGDH